MAVIFGWSMQICDLTSRLYWSLAFSIGTKMLLTQVWYLVTSLDMLFYSYSQQTLWISYPHPQDQRLDYMHHSETVYVRYNTTTHKLDTTRTVYSDWIVLHVCTHTLWVHATHMQTTSGHSAHYIARCVMRECKQWNGNTQTVYVGTLALTTRPSYSQQ